MRPVHIIFGALASACTSVAPVTTALLDTQGEIAASPPGDAQTRIERAAPEQERDPPRPVIAPRAAGPRLHTAEPGETMGSIATRYGETVETLEQMNGLAPPYEVRAGDVIVLPDRTQLAAPAPPTPAPAAPVIATTQPIAPRPGAAFARPVQGEVRARFGAQADGRRLDGVEFAASEGASVQAAADGRVVYAGQLEAYDHLVLIRHEDGYVTAYGYARRLLVSEGANVRAGQAVAEAGSRGRVLFQIRQGATPIDPLPLLGE